MGLYDFVEFKFSPPLRRSTPDKVGREVVGNTRKCLIKGAAGKYSNRNDKQAGVLKLADNC